jgi:uncharacterized SAM-binding protein YcdF (DUF218 family)
LVLGLLFLGVLGYAWRHALLVALGSYLITDEPRQAADAIVVLSGSVPDRVLEAVDLFNDGLAPRIIFSREGFPPSLAVLRSRGGDMPERHDLNRSIAHQLGVPSEAIAVVEGAVFSTASEASRIVAYLHRAGFRQILLVTSKMHSRRASLIFRRHAGRRLSIRVCASRYDSFDPSNWWHHRGLVRRLVFEYQKLLVFQLWDRWWIAASETDDQEQPGTASGVAIDISGGR